MSFRSARKKRGISALEAAEKLVPEIAKLYGCTIDELLEKDKEDNT